MHGCGQGRRRRLAAARGLSPDGPRTAHGQVKKAMMMEAQDYEGALDVICIHGGSITQVEQEEMPRLLGEASA